MEQFIQFIDELTTKSLQGTIMGSDENKNKTKRTSHMRDYQKPVCGQNPLEQLIPRNVNAKQFPVLLVARVKASERWHPNKWERGPKGRKIQKGIH